MARLSKVKAEVKPIVCAAPNYPDLVEDLNVLETPETSAAPKKRGRPKGSKNKSAQLAENISLKTSQAEPNTVLVASVAEEVMRKIAERRAEAKKMTEEAEKVLREGKEIARVEEMAKAKGPLMKKEKPPIPEELKEKPKEDFDVTRGVRESTEALVQEKVESEKPSDILAREKAEAEKAREDLRKKKFFEERARFMEERRKREVEEARKLEEKAAQIQEVEKPKAPELEKNKEKELERIRKKYAQWENLYRRGEEEGVVMRRAASPKKEELPKKKGFWDRFWSGWHRFWNEGRR